MAQVGEPAELEHPGHVALVAGHRGGTGGGVDHGRPQRGDEDRSTRRRSRTSPRTISQIGNQASGDTGRSSWTTGLSACQARLLAPISRPSGTPTSAASAEALEDPLQRGPQLQADALVVGAVVVERVGQQLAQVGERVAGRRQLGVARRRQLPTGRRRRRPRPPPNRARPRPGGPRGLGERGRHRRRRPADAAGARPAAPRRRPSPPRSPVARRGRRHRRCRRPWSQGWWHSWSRRLLVGLGRVERDAVELHVERRHVVVGDVDALGVGDLGVEVAAGSARRRAPGVRRGLVEVAEALVLGQEPDACERRGKLVAPSRKNIIWSPLERLLAEVGAEVVVAGEAALDVVGRGVDVLRRRRCVSAASARLSGSSSHLLASSTAPMTSLRTSSRSVANCSADHQRLLGVVLPEVLGGEVGEADVLRDGHGVPRLADAVAVHVADLSCSATICGGGIGMISTVGRASMPAAFSQ